MDEVPESEGNSQPIPFPKRTEKEKVRAIREGEFENFRKMIKELKAKKAFVRMIEQASWCNECLKEY